MLDARPNPWVLRWFNWYCRVALRRHFHNVQLEGELPADTTRGRLCIANHSNFWDGIVLNFLLRPLGQPLYCMIDEVQVKKHPFFRGVGGFSVDRSRPRSALRSLEYAAGLLNAGAAVILFPQGKQEPSDERPLVFERGVARLLEQAQGCVICPIALLYEFAMEQRPEIHVRIGREWPADAFIAIDGVDRLQVYLTMLLDESRAAYLSGNSTGRKILQGQASINQWRGWFSC